MAAWWFKVEGQDLEIGAVQRRAEGLAIEFRTDQHGPQIRCPEADNLDHSQALDLTRRRLELINGLLKVERRDFRPLKLHGAAIEEFGPGKRNYVLTVEPGALVLRGGDIGLSIGGKRVPERSETWTPASLAVGGDKLREAISEYGQRPTTWHDLYFVYELILEGVDRKTIVSRKWATDRQISRFTGTANDRRLAGPGARHGRWWRTMLPSWNAMTLKEADELIRTLLSRWLDHASGIGR